MRVIDLAELERLGEITLGRGKVISAKTLAHHPGEYPVYSSSTRGDGVFGRYGLYVFDEELLTWSVDGGGDIFHRTQHRFSITNVAGFLRINTKLIDYRYLYYLLRFKHSRADFDWTYKAHPSVLRRVYRDLPIPALEEQKRIARILDEADLVRKKTQALIDKYDELAQSLFLDMFGDPVTNPKGWEVKPLEECCSVQGGATPKRNVDEYWGEGLDWFTPKDLSALRTRHIGKAPEQITTAGLNSCSAKLIPANSLLLSSRAPIGHIAITTFNCCTNQGFQSLIPNSELVNIDYLYHVIKLSVPRLKDMGRGATFKELSKTMVKGFEIPLPQICLQQDFSKRMTALTVQQDSLLKTLDAASDNFNALLQKAFKGELT
jgi:type I restriction enzyme S subunit